MSEHPIEVEIKIAVNDLDAVRQCAIKNGAIIERTVIQIDTYLAHPCRDFSETDEAFRIRTTIKDGDNKHFEMTYKGPKIDSTTKTRVEINSSVTDISGTKSILEALGFKEVVTIEKHRTFLRADDILLSLDEVGHVGTFIEVETVVNSNDAIDVARESLFDFLRKLNLSPDESIRESYLELYLKQL